MKRSGGSARTLGSLYNRGWLMKPGRQNKRAALGGGILATRGSECLAVGAKKGGFQPPIAAAQGCAGSSFTLRMHRPAAVPNNSLAVAHQHPGSRPGVAAVGWPPSGLSTKHCGGRLPTAGAGLLSTARSPSYPSQIRSPSLRHVRRHCAAPGSTRRRRRSAPPRA